MHRLLILLPVLVCSFSATAAEKLTVTVKGIADGARIPAKYAYCIATEKEKSGKGQNISPEISWSKGPEGTKSYAILMIDPDVPTVFDDAGKEGKTLAKDMPRQDFYHWIALNIPADVQSIGEGLGKPVSKTQTPWISGINDYPKFMKITESLSTAGRFAGYDGPCPPWNDERVHHYHFKVYALNRVLDVPVNIHGKEAAELIQSNILAEGEAVGTYALNPALK